MNGAALLIPTYHHPMRVVDAADFDGINDHMLRGAALSSIADSKKGTVSFWFRVDGGDGTGRFFMSQPVTACLQILTSLNPINIVGKNTAGTNILSILSASSYLAGASWHHLLASWDLAITTAHYYIDDVDDKAGGATITDDTINYDGPTNWSIGANTAGTSNWNGALAEFFFIAGQYMDLTKVSNRRKFRSASGKPVHLGTDGSLPFGVVPSIYLHLDDAEAVANFATNRGNGGNFTITGTLDTASSSPSD